VLVAQAMRNLVSNAIKYTHDGGVTLRSRRTGTSLRLEVEDTGVGIGADELQRVCEDFYQVGVGSNASREGYGLGLSIVSRIAALLGLKLDIRSSPGKGSVFSLELPAAGAPEAAGAAAAAKPADGPAGRNAAGRTHILLVEDDAGVRNATRMLLKVEGHAVSAAGSLKEAVGLANEHPDIKMLISDYHLASQETGLQVVAAVRAALSPDLKAILVTGDTSSAMRALASDSNLRAVSKPVRADELLGLVDQLLRE
jgi:two-component system CheB/CheR fusion protein